MSEIFGICDFSHTVSLNEMERLALAGIPRSNILSLNISNEKNYSLALAEHTRACNKGGRISSNVVKAGRIANINEIIAALEKNNVKFDRRCINGTLSAAYKVWGMKFAEKLNGMFSIAVYDKDKEKLYIVRDTAGASPMYYYSNENIFLFGSNLPQIHASPLFKKELDINGIALYLRHRFIPSPHTAFKNTYKLEPGCFIEVNLKTREIRKQKYMDVFSCFTGDTLSISESEAIAETEKILLAAVNDIAGERNTSGVVLTGGYDSSAAAAFLQAQRSYKIKTFTVGMEDAGFNEAPYAKKIARHIGTEHHEAYITQEDLKSIFEKYPGFYPEPLGDIVSLPVMAYCSLASAHVSSIFSGEGADETFGGYRYHYNNINYFNAFVSMPQFVKRSASAAFALLSPLPFLNKHLQKKDKLKKLSLLSRAECYRARVEPVYFTRDEVSSLISHGDSYKTCYDEIYRLADIKDKMNIMLAMDYSTIVPDKNIYLINAAAKGYGMSIREPFTDKRLLEFLGKIPAKLKYKNGISKYLLKQAVHKYIPQDIMKRPGAPASIPVSAWLNTFLKEYVYYYLDEKRVKRGGILNQATVSNYVRRFYSNESVNADKIWMLLTFQLWLEKWVQ